MADERIIFFDGVCNLCNGFVDTVIRADRSGMFKFAPLQGETAKTKLPPTLRESLTSVVYYENGRIYTEADAVLRIAKNLPGAARVFGTLGQFLPQFITLASYRLIAANRYRLFGRRESCRLPTPGERSRFLD